MLAVCRALHLDVLVPPQLSRPHPLVAELRAAANGAEEDRGKFALNYAKVFRVRTSRQGLTCGLILIKTLIREDVKVEANFMGYATCENHQKDWWKH